MTDLFFQMGLSNACFAGVLAVLATLVGLRSARPHLAHCLWLLVFIKLVTPPIINVPVELLSPAGETAAADLAASDPLAGAGYAGTARELATPAPAALPTSWQSTASTIWQYGKPWLGWIWLAGSLVLVGGSVSRVWRFNRLLNQNTRVAPASVRQVARRLSGQLGLPTVPLIETTSAGISPMVWWIGGRVRVILPASLLKEMSVDQWRWVLAHELAHVRRRDYLVRWLEWTACVCFWWNPVVWWAQRNLRATEEICCDSLILSRLKPTTHSYATSILSAVESLVAPVARPPMMASEINSGGFLERRIEMIMSGTAEGLHSRIARYTVFTLALLVVPLGVAHAQDYEKVQKQLMKSVKKGHLSPDQAKAMMATLKKSAAGETPRDDERLERLTRIAETMRQLDPAGKSARADVNRLREVQKVLESLQAARLAEDDMSGKIQDVEKLRRLAIETGDLAAADSARLAEQRQQLLFQARESARQAELTDHVQGIDKKLKQALERGDLSAAEANSKMQALAESLAAVRDRQDSAHSKSKRTARLREDDRAAVAKQLDLAVEAGKLSREEAVRKLEELQVRSVQRERKAADAEQALKMSRELESLGQRLRDAADAGKLTSGEAREKWAAMAEELARREAQVRELKLRQQKAADKQKATNDEKTADKEKEKRRQIQRYEMIRRELEQQKALNEEREMKIRELMRKLEQKRAADKQ